MHVPIMFRLKREAEEAAQAAAQRGATVDDPPPGSPGAPTVTSYASAKPTLASAPTEIGTLSCQCCYLYHGDVCNVMRLISCMYYGKCVTFDIQQKLRQVQALLLLLPQWQLRLLTQVVLRTAMPSHPWSVS